MKVNPAPLHLAQTIVLGLVCAMSIAILGTAAHTLDVFDKQQPTNPWWLPMWPQHFKTAGTKALIVSATAVFVLSAVFMVVSLIPSFNMKSRPTFHAFLALGTTIPAAIVSLMATIYAHILNKHDAGKDTIQTWTCKYMNSQPLLQQNPVMPSGMGNGNFGALCKMSKFALWGTLTVFLLVTASIGLTIVTWMADKWSARQTRKEILNSPE